MMKFLINTHKYTRTVLMMLPSSLNNPFGQVA